MSRKIRLLSCFLLATSLIPSAALAVEVDDISASQVELKDSLEVLNRKVQDVLARAVSETKACRLKEFETLVLSGLTPKGILNRTFFGGIERFAMESPEIERFRIPLDESIYRGTPLARAFFVAAGKFFRIGDIFPSIRLNGETIGTDKLSHFFETGYELFDENLRESSYGTLTAEQIDRLVHEAIRLEDENLGLGITGIKSFGDLHAHLQGALFWKALLSADGGWLSCEKGRFVLKRRFDFRDFVQPGWSEAINCNVYAEGRDASSIFDLIQGAPPSYIQTIRSNARELEEKTGRRHTCPLRPAECEKARAKLESYDPRLKPHMDSLMSPSCAKAEFDSFRNRFGALLKRAVG